MLLLTFALPRSSSYAMKGRSDSDLVHSQPDYLPVGGSPTAVRRRSRATSSQRASSVPQGPCCGTPHLLHRLARSVRVVRVPAPLLLLLPQHSLLTSFTPPVSLSAPRHSSASLVYRLYSFVADLISQWSTPARGLSPFSTSSGLSLTPTASPTSRSTLKLWKVGQDRRRFEFSC